MKVLPLVLGLLVMSSLPAQAAARAPQQVERPGLFDLEAAMKPKTVDQRVEEGSRRPVSSPMRTTALVLGGTGVGAALAGGLLLAQEGDQAALGGTLVGVGAVSTLIGGVLYFKSSQQARALAQRREDQPPPVQADAAVDKKRLLDKVPKRLPIVSFKF